MTSEPATRPLQALLEVERARRGCLVVPGVWDALSARLAAQAGFEAAFVSGFAVSAALLGLPDLGYLDRTDLVATVRRMVLAAPGLSLLVDADTGFGNAVGAARTATELAGVGAAGLVIEDQTSPKRCGHLAGKEVVPVDEWLAKLVAAKEAAPDLVLVGRTDSAGPLGLDEALSRAAAAAEAGADVVFVEAPGDAEALARTGRELAPCGRPLAVNLAERAGSTPEQLQSGAEVAALGFTLGISPVTALFAATRAASDLYAHVREAGTGRDRLADLVTYEDFNVVVGTADHLASGARLAGQDG